MKQFLAILLAAATICTSANGQTLSRFRTKLTAQSTSNSSNFSTIEVNEERAARQALLDLEADRSRAKVSGYRVGVFLSNGANARAQANAVVAICDSLYSDIVTSLTYDNPYFKVNAGYCLTLEEGVMLLNRLQGRFPRAYLLREEIQPRDLVRSWNREKNLRK
ncbi:MAG: hypothetical protein SNH79_00870 [Rikenellaceae bacterium]